MEDIKFQNQHKNPGGGLQGEVINTITNQNKKRQKTRKK
jgi:hypothetical protein